MSCLQAGVTQHPIALRANHSSPAHPHEIAPRLDGSEWCRTEMDVAVGSQRERDADQMGTELWWTERQGRHSPTSCEQDRDGGGLDSSDGGWSAVAGTGAS